MERSTLISCMQQLEGEFQIFWGSWLHLATIQSSPTWKPNNLHSHVNASPIRENENEQTPTVAQNTHRDICTWEAMSGGRNAKGVQGFSISSVGVQFAAMVEWIRKGLSRFPWNKDQEIRERILVQIHSKWWTINISRGAEMENHDHVLHRALPTTITEWITGDYRWKLFDVSWCTWACFGSGRRPIGTLSCF
jgi:hypothetical protein